MLRNRIRSGVTRTPVWCTYFQRPRAFAPAPSRGALRSSGGEGGGDAAAPVTDAFAEGDRVCCRDAGDANEWEHGTATRPRFHRWREVCGCRCVRTGAWRRAYGDGRIATGVLPDGWAGAGEPQGGSPDAGG
eukprot:gene9149-14284_t